MMQDEAKEVASISSEGSACDPADVAKGECWLVDGIVRVGGAR